MTVIRNGLATRANKQTVPGEALQSGTGERESWFKRVEDPLGILSNQPQDSQGGHLLDLLHAFIVHGVGVQLHHLKRREACETLEHLRREHAVSRRGDDEVVEGLREVPEAICFDGSR